MSGRRLGAVFEPCWPLDAPFRTHIPAVVVVVEVRLQLEAVVASVQKLKTARILWTEPPPMLAAQLAQSASLSAKSLKDQKYIDSYLFPPHQARQHDLDTIFQLAQNGLQLLATSSSSLKTLKSPLFSRSTKFIDRTRLSPEENHTLNDQIKDLLFAISPFLTEQGASNIIEWLVRRYRYVHLYSRTTN